MSDPDRDASLAYGFRKYLSPAIAAAFASDAVDLQPPRSVTVEYFALQFQTSEYVRFNAALGQADTVLSRKDFRIGSLLLGCMVAFRTLPEVSCSELDAIAKTIGEALGINARVIYGTATGFEGTFGIGSRFFFSTLLNNSHEVLETLMSIPFGTVRRL